ncbi:hypothetical protein BJV77DRAFT_721364 [Russula vinacea]|nr:hypothetical protein BJV77DRAFT_721364 [Russula vinacea]
MTDRSNYGPVRRLSLSVSTDSRKPYSRIGLKGVLGTVDLNSGDTAVPTPPDSPYYPFHAETPQLEPLARTAPVFPMARATLRGSPRTSSTSASRKNTSRLSRSASTQGAHLPGALRQDLCRPAERLRGPCQHCAVSFLGPQDVRPRLPSDVLQPQRRPDTPEPVVLHDKRPVAIREQLYEVLCYCHAVARHGGRTRLARRSALTTRGSLKSSRPSLSRPAPPAR